MKWMKNLHVSMYAREKFFKGAPEAEAIYDQKSIAKKLLREYFRMSRLILELGLKNKFIYVRKDHLPNLRKRSV